MSYLLLLACKPSSRQWRTVSKEVGGEQMCKNAQSNSNSIVPLNEIQLQSYAHHFNSRLFFQLTILFKGFEWWANHSLWRCSTIIIIVVTTQPRWCGTYIDNNSFTLLYSMTIQFFHHRSCLRMSGWPWYKTQSMVTHNIIVCNEFLWIHGSTHIG